MNKHIDDTRYLQWADGMYVMIDDLEDDYEMALVEGSLRGSVYFEDKQAFNRGYSEDCLGVHMRLAGLLWSEDLSIKLTREQALYIATGETSCTTS
jgi:hypothetical protein